MHVFSLAEHSDSIARAGRQAQSMNSLTNQLARQHGKQGPTQSASDLGDMDLLIHLHSKSANVLPQAWAQDVAYACALA